MKNYLYLFIISLSMLSCYTYKVKSENVDKPIEKVDLSGKTNGITGNQIARTKEDVSISEIKSSSRKGKIEKEENRQPTDIKEKLETNKYFKIEVGGKPYKIQVDKWESDTLVAHVIHKPKRVLKFHKNQINEATIAERHFSQPTADIITVLAYAGIGVGIWALVR